MPYRTQGLGYSCCREPILFGNQDHCRAGILGGSEVAAGEPAANFFPQPPLFHHPLQPRERAHACEKSDVVHRFGQEIIGANLEPAKAIGNVRQGSHHDYGNIGGPRIGL
jgi:hypothetical protein